jgi:hypothetical protein
METIRELKIIMLALLVVTLWVLAPVTQAEASHREFEFSEAPQLVSLTGILHPPGEKGVAGIDAFTIYIQGKECWIFDVKQARDISGMEPGLAILQDLFPSTLRLVGPQNLIFSLEKPELSDKLITVQGYLHVAYNMLKVIAVKNVPG